MNLPNILTVSRFLFAVLILGLLWCNTLAAIIAATVLFAVAACTDYFDGYLAKKRGMVSDFGKIMDPIADKALMLLVFFALAGLGVIFPWMVAVILVREVAVTVSRLNAVHRGQVIPAEKAGKVKTVCQMLTVGVALLYLICDQSAAAAGWFYRVEGMWRLAIQALMILSVAVTVYSGWEYFRNKWNSAGTSSSI